MTFFNFNDIIQQMDKDELMNLLSYYIELIDDANALIYDRGVVIDTLQRLTQDLNEEHLADRHYRNKRSVIEKVESELTAKYSKPVEGNTGNSCIEKINKMAYVNPDFIARSKTDCTDHITVNSKDLSQ